MTRHDQSIRVLSFPSELGWMAVALRDDAVCRLTFGHPSRRAAQKVAQRASIAARDTTNGADGNTADGNGMNGKNGAHRAKSSQESRAGDTVLIQRLQAYAKGAHDDFLDVRIEHDALAPFARRVIQNCRRIPPGSTLTYGQLAARAGSPRAARAVGNVMANNAVPLIVPCHRVVGAAGSMGGFSAPQGVDMKRRLLRMEGA